MSRPTIRLGSTGPHVVTVQKCLRALPMDGDFGPITEDAVTAYQRRRPGLEADGIVGPQTWERLEAEFHLPPWPPTDIGPLPPPFDQRLVDRICAIAMESEIASYEWEDRGFAPAGYIKGLACSFAMVVYKWHMRDSSAREMAKANTGDDDDVLAYYEDIFDALGMDNSLPGLTTLRHLFVFIMGLCMRESSGFHCEGRDMSADNVSSDTCEAGLSQMSWNASGCSSEMDKLMNQYESMPPQCALGIFADGVSCSSSDWECYGSGEGKKYQAMAKSCPQFACETTAIGLRNLRQHWGPVGRYEVEVRPEADVMLLRVQALVTYVIKRQQQEAHAA
jgi:Putative peptidoglycan binding domain